MAGQTITVSVLADTRKFRTAMRGLGDASGLSKLGAGLRTIGKGLAVGTGAVVAAGVAWAGTTAQALARVETLGAATANVISSTGGAAGRTKAQVEGLAGSIEKLSGLEAETVQEGQNLLLTFTNIKGANFDRATQAMADLGVAMNKGKLEGVDLQSSALQLGKALNDPIKGISALSRVGVSFTAAQKEQVQAMVAAGDAAGAQSIILAELERQFGGAAAAAGDTAAGKWAKIQNIFGEVSETVLGFLLPAMHAVADWITTEGLPRFEAFGAWVSGTLIPAIKDLAARFREDVLPRLRDTARWLAENVVPAIASLAGWITGTLVPALVSFGGWVRDNADWLKALAVAVGLLVVGIGGYIKVMALWKAAKTAAIAVQAAWNAVMAANPVGLLILAIAALVAGLVYFFTQTETGKAIVASAWAGIQSAIEAVTSWWSETALPAITGTWDAITGAFRAGKDAVVGFLEDALSWVVRVWSYSPLGLIVTNWSRILEFFRGLPAAVGRLFTAAGVWLVNAGSSIINGLKSGIDRAWTNVLAFITDIPNRFVRGLSRIGSVLYNSGRDLISGFLSGAGSLLTTVGNFFLSKLPSWIVGPFKAALGINSPSRVFAGFAGDTIAGYLGRVRRLMPELAAASRAMASTVAGSFTPELAVPALEAPAAGFRAGGAYAGPAPVINVYALTDGPEVGRRVHAALEDFYRLNGRRP